MDKLESGSISSGKIRLQELMNFLTATVKLIGIDYLKTCPYEKHCNDQAK